MRLLHRMISPGTSSNLSHGPGSHVIATCGRAPWHALKIMGVNLSGAGDGHMGHGPTAMSSDSQTTGRVAERTTAGSHNDPETSGRRSVLCGPEALFWALV